VWLLLEGYLGTSTVQRLGPLYVCAMVCICVWGVIPGALSKMVCVNQLETGEGRFTILHHHAWSVCVGVCVWVSEGERARDKKSILAQEVKADFEIQRHPEMLWYIIWRSRGRREPEPAVMCGGWCKCVSTLLFPTKLSSYGTLQVGTPMLPRPHWATGHHLYDCACASQHPVSSVITV